MPTLMGELKAFQVRFTAKGRYTYAARSGEHDDRPALHAKRVRIIQRCSSRSSSVPDSILELPERALVAAILVDADGPGCPVCR